ncbi:interleukin-12 subunit beta-like [Sceloporus undulatus]|uniref:interleukin-12 subunit beta-like n=1 Tax=Sceloporus undulatus TaxID=8520 RepID=UPI001C4A9451|nr:interleukin-12 subunit beta-like [Sceloporus undulatus]XP_042322929.1 interleukin-12 subunit beta-like [Sceloporus undulatus]
MWLATLLALALFPAGDAASAAWGSFPAELSVGELDREATLQCPEASAGQAVCWRKGGGKAVCPRPPRGPTLRLPPLDLSSAGNYSCWAGGTLLGWTFLAVRGLGLPRLLDEAAGVTCEAESYNSTVLRCAWLALRPAAFRLRLRRRGPGGAGAGCSSVEKVVGGRGPTWVELDASACGPECPSAEEVPETGLELELEGLGAGGRFQRMRRRLFWRDLVRPAAPEGLAARQEESTGQLRLSWAPPPSWVRPSSFFPLRFHLRLEFFGNLDREGLLLLSDLYSDRLEETAQPPRPHQLLNRVKIRCRDPIAPSPWSPWSAWAFPQ